jgi:two-component system, OmpR family, sensor kinase
MSKILGTLKSIRAKLTLWYALILLTTLIAFALVSYTYSSRNLADNLDRSLRHEVKWVKNFIEQKATKVKPSKKFGSKKKPPPETPSGDISPEDEGELNDADDEIWDQIYEHALRNPKKTLIEVTDKKATVIFRSTSVSEDSLMIGDVPRDTVKISTVRSEKGEELRVAATASENLRIYVAYPLSELGEVLDNLFSIFLILIPIALTISVGGGWFLANKSLRPVDEVTRTARQITAQNLDQQIPVRDVDDEIGRLILTLNEMIARLRQSFEQIKQFSIDASHELRTPLTIMRGEVEIALGHTKTLEEYREVLVSNLEEILRLSAIIDNLLTLSKADLGQQTVQFEKVNLKELITELYEDSEILALKKQIVFNLTKNEDVSIQGDKLRLRQLFLNLVDNAIKYTPEKGSVSLSLERQNGIALVKVQDTGIGIPKEDQMKIFDRFYRVDKGRSRELGGSGLGLSIAKWIAELHKGHIGVKSEPEKGSTFTVYLPLS